MQLAHRENVLTIPIVAVQRIGNTGTVLVLNANHQVEQRSVQLGLRGSTLVEVTNGLDVYKRQVPHFLLVRMFEEGWISVSS